MQAAAMSLTAVAAAVAVVRASRRRAVGDAPAGDLPALGDSAFADAGRSPIAGGTALRDKDTASSAAAAR
ncbi:hypothetical protein DKT69_10420 [Micromonospora sicca]|uniref:Uncharacterized protein n=2 Tax=Micromonosporaceae TaxID=28056 RepID=A0A317DLK9_9ACTN|nr:hypothetical protein DKT69_10420 [Micromonospora sp. 4G51]